MSEHVRVSYRLALRFLDRECEGDAMNELQFEPCVRLVAALAHRRPMEVAGDLCRIRNRRKRVVEAIRSHAGPTTITAIAREAEADRRVVEREVSRLIEKGIVRVRRRRDRSPMLLMYAGGTQ